MEETTNTLEISSFENTPEALTIAEKLAANVAGALAPRTIGNATMLTLPDGYSVKDITDSIEAAQPHRNRAKGTVLLSDVASLLAYCKGQVAQNLLAVATTIRATNGINFSSARRLQDGQTQLTYNEVIDAKAGTDGALKIPQTFALGLRIFKNGEGYKLTARLKYRINSGQVKFWYELERPERAVEDAFTGYVETVREQSGYTVLIGKA